jgi:hypothetical protein
MVYLDNLLEVVIKVAFTKRFRLGANGKNYHRILEYVYSLIFVTLRSLKNYI